MKQVIIIRKDLNMRKGKIAAQAAHASLGAYQHAVRDKKTDNIKQWQKGFNGRKICVYVESEKQLIELYTKAYDFEITRKLVKDIGLTEFKQPTFTAVCLGPNEDELIDKLTGDLPLL